MRLPQNIKSQLALFSVAWCSNRCFSPADGSLELKLYKKPDKKCYKPKLLDIKAEMRATSSDKVFSYHLQTHEVMYFVVGYCQIAI